MFKTIMQDLNVVFERDPAATSKLEVILTYAGFHALLAYRLSHWLWARGVPFVPRVISQLARWLTGIEIHPAAKIGTGFFIDHGMAAPAGAHDGPHQHPRPSHRPLRGPRARAARAAKKA